MNIQEIENQHLIQLYGKRDIALVKGEGVFLIDEQGKRYLDFTSNYGANILGYGNEYFLNEVKEQLFKLTNAHSSFFNDARAEFLEKLHSIIPLTRSFICNTGTEAIEAALKFARLATGKTKFISAQGAYHGRTFGALSATGIKKYQEAFLPLVPGFIHIPYNDISALDQVLSNEVAAVILEPIQGESGVRIPAMDYIQQARQSCDAYGALLILDEVQTGFRTGDWLASSVIPDVLCLSKGLGNGFPIGVTSVSEAVCEKIPKGSHGTTFGGNPLACRAALAVMQEIENKNLHNNVYELGKYFVEQLRGLKSQSLLIREARGKGFMLAIECKQKAGQYVKSLQDKGLLVMSNNNILRLLPSLAMSKEEIDQGLNILKEVF